MLNQNHVHSLSEARRCGHEGLAGTTEDLQHDATQNPRHIGGLRERGLIESPDPARREISVRTEGGALGASLDCKSPI